MSGLQDEVIRDVQDEVIRDVQDEVIRDVQDEVIRDVQDEVIRDVLLADQPTKRFVKPSEIAALVRHLCSDDAISICGACLSIDGGWTAR